MSKSYLYLCACACTCTSSWYLVPCTFCACLLPLLLCACAYGNIYGILRFTVYGLRFTVYTVPCTSTVYLYTLYVLIGTYAVRSNEHYNKAQHNSSTHETVEQSRFPTREWSRCYTENFLFWPLQITRIQTWFHTMQMIQPHQLLWMYAIATVGQMSITVTVNESPQFSQALLRNCHRSRRCVWKLNIMYRVSRDIYTFYNHLKQSYPIS